MTRYIPTIGLEIHAELKTASKMFCGCRNNPDETKPNKNVCSVCLGHPGTLPVINKEAIKSVLKVGFAVNGSIADFTEWDRKNYFYPDIPKGYQISQYKYPLVTGGKLLNVELERIHLEEDTAQSTHDTHEKSLVNFNRSGVPLLELVTKPVIHDAETAVAFAKELQLLLRYLNAGEANLEKGEMRVEANISVANEEDTRAQKFGTKTEVKNLNSFRSVGRAIEHEVERQIEVIKSGKKVVQETRGWDDGKKETYSQRSKESSEDYRYFPEPDIPKLKLSEIKEFSPEVLRKEIPLLPSDLRKLFSEKFGHTPKEVSVFVDSPALSKYFLSVVGSLSVSAKSSTDAKVPPDSKKVKLATNYLLTDLLGLLKKNDSMFDPAINSIENKVSVADFVELVNMAAAGEISSRGAKDILALLVSDQSPSVASTRKLAEKYDLIQKSNSSSLVPAVEKVIAENPTVVAEFKSGKVASLQYLIGQVMRATKGSANPEVSRKLFLERLS